MTQFLAAVLPIPVQPHPRDVSGTYDVDALNDLREQWEQVLQSLALPDAVEPSVLVPGRVLAPPFPEPAHRESWESLLYGPLSSGGRTAARHVAINHHPSISVSPHRLGLGEATTLTLALGVAVGV